MSSLSITFFESFSPELFVEIFCYLNGFDIYKAFFGLNHRLSSLVLTYGMKCIDLSEIKLNESRKMLSDINCSEVNTLKLSNRYNDEQIDQILNINHFSLSQFNYLSSLTLDSIGLFTFNSIIRQNFNLYHLKSLIIRFRSGLCREKLLIMYKFILYKFSFRFESLKLLNLSVLDVNEPIIDTPLESAVQSKNNSSSLESLSIENIRNDHIETLLSHFPNLYKLNATIKLNRSKFDYPLLLNLTFCTLKIHSCRFKLLVCLLKQCCNLKQLILDIDSDNNDEEDSYPLENLIENYLLKLKQFQLHMIINYTSLDIIQDLFNNKFLQNQFWLERKTKINITNKKSTIDEGLEAEVVIQFSI